MAGSISGIWNQVTNQNGLVTENPIHSEATTGSSGGNSANISANDFLTLLVTEMQNQDPTANTDPNEYINQLVQVNSLEQLISINQTLTEESTPTPVHKVISPVGKQDSASPQAVSKETTHGLTPLAPAESVSGNLSIPSSNPSAQRIAQALGGQVNRQ